MRPIYEELEAIYKAKNADYGDSFGKSIAEYGILAGVIRMDDKMRRLKNLVRDFGEADVERMEARRHETTKLTADWYHAMIKHYQSLLKDFQ